MRDRRRGGAKRALLLVLFIGVGAVLAAPMVFEPPAPTRMIESDATIDFEAALSR